MKKAIVVEMDLKEVQAILIEAAKKEAGIKEGTNHIEFLYENAASDNYPRVVNGVQVRFGNNVTEPPPLPLEGADVPPGVKALARARQQLDQGGKG